MARLRLGTLAAAAAIYVVVAIYLTLGSLSLRGRKSRFLASLSQINISARPGARRTVDEVYHREAMRKIIENSLRQENSKPIVDDNKQRYGSAVESDARFSSSEYVSAGLTNAGNSLKSKVPKAPKIKNEVNRTYCTVYDLTQPAESLFQCLPLNVTPSTPICLHDPKKDIHLSNAVIRTGIWEPFTVKYIQTLLQRDLDMGFIDLGCNLGVFSLIVAKMGHKVVSVEPFRDNIVRFHRALQLGNLTSNVVLVQNAVSDTRGAAKLKLSSDNQGDTQVEKDSDFAGADESRPPGVTFITMDDLLEVIDFKRAVIKMDIQGFEHRAIVGGQKLLDTLFVPYIFMEWIILNKYFDDPYTLMEDNKVVVELAGMMLSKGYKPMRLAEERRLVHRAVAVLTERGYTPYSLTGEKLPTEHCNAWPFDVVWKHKDA